MSRFVLEPKDNTIGYINLEVDKNLFQDDLRILIHMHEYIVNGDLKVSLEQYSFKDYKYKWITLDSITIRDYNDLDNSKLWRSSLTWEVSFAMDHPNTKPRTINYLITKDTNGFHFKEIKNFAGREPVVNELGYLLNRFNLMVIKEIIKKKIKG